MADAVSECRTAANQAAELTETGETGLLRLVEILCAAKVQRGQAGGAVLEGTEVQIFGRRGGPALRLPDRVPLCGSAGAGGLCGAFQHGGPPSCWGNGLIKEPRLRFTEEETGGPGAGKSPFRKAEKAAVKADKAQAKIPKKQVKRAEVDPKTGKVTTKLVLEDKPRARPPNCPHTVRDAPGNAVAGKLHQEIRKTEDGNVGVESAHKSEEAVENRRASGEGRATRSHKLKPLPQGPPRAEAEAGKGQHRGAVPEVCL